MRVVRDRWQWRSVAAAASNIKAAAGGAAEGGKTAAQHGAWHVADKYLKRLRARRKRLMPAKGAIASCSALLEKGFSAKTLLFVCRVR